MSLKPQFFLTRQNGSMVPLVAMDEVPAHISIEGVPRTLSPHDVVGMTCVGTSESRHQCHVVKNMNQSPAAPLHPLTRDSSVPRHTGMTDHSSSTGSSWRSTANGHGSKSLHASKYATSSVDQNTSSHQTSLAVLSHPFSRQSQTAGTSLMEQEPNHGNSNGSGGSDADTLVVPPSTTSISSAPDDVRGRKIYCSYWCRRGECDFTQQGCMYKHEMPLTLEGLQSVGLQDWPRWWREQNGFGSFRATPGAGASFAPASLASMVTSGHGHSAVVAPTRYRHARGGMRGGGRGGAGLAFSHRTAERTRASTTAMHERQNKSTLHQLSRLTLADTTPRAAAAAAPPSPPTVPHMVPRALLTSTRKARAARRHGLSRCILDDDLSDIEAEYHREDVERKKREDEFYTSTSSSASASPITGMSTSSSEI